MQSIEEIEKHYATPDPWGYQTNPEDIRRKNYIIDISRMFCKLNDKYEDDYLWYETHLYSNALDVGCGEGWITSSLPSRKKFGYEISKVASNRFPRDVIKLSSDIDFEKNKPFDIILATGILYNHYDYKHFIEIINRFSADIILTCNIKDWEVHEIKNIEAKQIFEAEFPYREYTQKLRVFKK